MHIRKGKGRWAFTPMASGLAALLVGGASQAALVTVSGIVTNNTATTQSYTFSQKVRIGETITNAGAFGSLSLMVTDFNRNGALLESDGGMLYSGLARNSLVKSYMPLTTPSAFSLSAPARSMGSHNSTFASAAAPEALASLAGQTFNPDDEIEVRVNFRLSAGDQAAYTAVLNFVSVPGPGAAAMALLAPWIGLHRRRRTENDA